MKRIVIGLSLTLVACPEEQSHIEMRAWNEPCQDQSTLLATTAGSPSFFKCPNKRHHMRVQLASAPSHEEFGALVFCECERDGTSVVDAGGE